MWKSNINKNEVKGNINIFYKTREATTVKCFQFTFPSSLTAVLQCDDEMVNYDDM